jgi:hypothetical protein
MFRISGEQQATKLIEALQIKGQVCFLGSWTQDHPILIPEAMDIRVAYYQTSDIG